MLRQFFGGTKKVVAKTTANNRPNKENNRSRPYKRRGNKMLNMITNLETEISKLNTTTYTNSIGNGIRQQNRLIMTNMTNTRKAFGTEATGILKSIVATNNNTGSFKTRYNKYTKYTNINNKNNKNVPVVMEMDKIVKTLRNYKNTQMANARKAEERVLNQQKANKAKKAQQAKNAKNAQNAKNKELEAKLAKFKNEMKQHVTKYKNYIQPRTNNTNASNFRKNGKGSLFTMTNNLHLG